MQYRQRSSALQWWCCAVACGVGAACNAGGGVVPWRCWSGGTGAAPRLVASALPAAVVLRRRCCAVACVVAMLQCSGGASTVAVLCRGGAVPWRCCAVAELDKEVARKVLGIRRQVLPLADARPVVRCR